MIYRNINKLLFLFILNLYSCQTIDLLEKKEVYLEKYDDVYETQSFIDTDNSSKKNFKEIDYYNTFIINNFDINSIVKLKKISFYDNNIEFIKPLTPIFHKNNLVAISDYKLIKFYDDKNFDLNKEIILDINLDKKKSEPISFSKLNDIFFISYSDGTLVSFDFDGNILWKKEFNDIVKTPIKLFDGNIILLLTNKIISINPINSDINWEFEYENYNQNLLNSSGGQIINLNQFLYFILPNLKFGEVDSFFGEKNQTLLSDINFDNSLNYFKKKLHIYNNLFSYFDDNKFINTVDVYSNKFILNKFEISNISSSFYFNNSLFALNKDVNLRAYNIINKKIFWKTNLSDYLSSDNQIINIFSTSDNLIILFDNGYLFELSSMDGAIISHKKLKIKNILYMNSYKNFIFFIDNKNKIHLFSL